jgi:hypothetical protein
MRQIILHMRRVSSFIICRDQNRNSRNIYHQAGYIYIAFAILLGIDEGLDVEIIGKLGSHESLCVSVLLFIQLAYAAPATVLSDYNN